METRQHEMKTGLSFYLRRVQFNPGDTTKNNTPVICFHGSGAGSHYPAWAPLIEGIPNHTSVLFYERRSLDKQNPTEAVQDLITLLDELRLQPPFILVPHSYGGTIAREFLQHHPDQVAGMVLVETGQETPTTYNELQYRRQILGEKPLSVIHANSLHRMPQNSNMDLATKKMQQKFTAEDERLKKAQLRLSSNNRYVRLEECGHHVVQQRPDVVLNEIKWVMHNMKTVDGDVQEYKVLLPDLGSREYNPG
ncbi:alpha/beta-hydrolase [Myriangium duriaei CBS 260.36]|uniref:Alpha/beta-hydrolase n=1 Tax=Myriangium duriaei CBS 260.36 TaxID=1168546 RepID=A0A9P4IVX0_9PEZI|nr:alpha/beta-hydrolase [Myriangium duriaei CBS 260.36]